MGHASRIYFSRYLGKSVAKLDSSTKAPGEYSSFHSSSFQWSMSGLSQGLSRR